MTKNNTSSKSSASLNRALADCIALGQCPRYLISKLKGDIGGTQRLLRKACRYSREHRDNEIIAFYNAHISDLETAIVWLQARQGPS